MTDTFGPDSAARFSDALVSEIKAEMGRRDLSTRALGRLIGQSSQYLSMRLDGGNSRTGKRVEIHVVDIIAIADALGISATDLINQARAAAAKSEARDQLGE